MPSQHLNHTPCLEKRSVAIHIHFYCNQGGWVAAMLLTTSSHLPGEVYRVGCFAEGLVTLNHRVDDPDEQAFVFTRLKIFLKAKSVLLKAKSALGHSYFVIIAKWGDV